MESLKVEIVSDREATEELMRFSQGGLGARLVTTCFQMRQGEPWAIDALRFSADGDPVDVSDERGTCDERFASLKNIQNMFCNEAFQVYVRGDQHLAGIDEQVIGLLSMVNSTRCLALIGFLRQLAPAYVEQLLSRVVAMDAENQVAGRVIHERLMTLNRVNQLTALLSEEAIAVVQATFKDVKS